MINDRYSSWPNGLLQEMEANRSNGCVGSILVSETDDLRIWHLHLPPGTRCPFHRHVLHYFWTCHSRGKARSYFEDGRMSDIDYFPGDTKHHEYASGEYLFHCIENIGDTDLLFTTVELKDRSKNSPLAIPDTARLKPAGESVS